MLSSLVFLVGVLQSQHKPLLNQMGVKPTGRNGYEELVQAAISYLKGAFQF